MKIEVSDTKITITMWRKPIKICPSCSAKFSFDSSDIEYDNEQYWGGLRWGWQIREYRFVTCPICKREIKLK